MRVLILDPDGWFDFESLGHEVSTAFLTEYETPLAPILDRLSRPPDCIIQQEKLGERRFVTGLENAPCPTLYLAFDAHLNLYWQRFYGRLFDAVLTPHLALFEALPPEDRLSNVFRLLPPGRLLPWRTHASRRHALAFCGRLTADRPVRTNMISLLQRRFGLDLRQEISQEAMFRLYRDTRVIPNEAICFEVNCRLFEGASAGAAMLTPDCGPDQQAAFADGEEILLYQDGLDLCLKIAWLRDNPDKAETMGKRAHARIRRDHLPVNRAAQVLDILPALSQARATGPDAATAAWLTRLERTTSGDRHHPASALLIQGAALPQVPEVLAGMLHLLGSPARKAPAMELARQLLDTGTASSSALCNAAASACALAHGDMPLAQDFFRRQFPGSPPPETPAGLCLAWAESERKAGRAVRPGFAFSPSAGHLPACAREFLVFARHISPRDRAALAAEEAQLLAPFPAYANHRLSLLESLRDAPGVPDTREIARLLLFCCRVDEGLALLGSGRETGGNAS